MLAKAAIYLDSNAGAPLSPQVAQALLPFLGEAGGFIPNPSSIHSHGRSAKRALADAREKTALKWGVGVDPEQLVLTSSGSEANQLVIRSVLETALASSKTSAPHWITTSVEHDSVQQMIRWFEERGGSVSIIPVDTHGVLRWDILSEMLASRKAQNLAPSALLSAVWVNNETGVITDAVKLRQITLEYSIPLHLDAAQAWGKLPCDLKALNAEYVTFSAHKIGGLAGTGGVWLKRGSRVQPLILGKQEKGRRGGTENLLGIIAMGAAASQIQPEKWSLEIAPLRDRLEQAILERIPGAFVNGSGAERVANTLSVSFDGVEGDGLVMALDLAGYSVSSGSACSSGVLEPSHVLLAMGRTRPQAMAAVRISLSQALSWDILEGFVNALSQVVSRVRKASLASSNISEGKSL